MRTASADALAGRRRRARRHEPRVGAPPGEDGASRLQAALVELRRAVDVLETSAEDLPVGDLGQDGGLVDALEPTFRAQEAAFAVMEVARNVARALEAERRPWLRRLLGRDPEGTGARWARRSTGPGPTSTRARSGCTTACAAASPSAPRCWSPTCPGVQHSFWVVLGTLSVLRSNALSTGQTVLRGIAGTVVGIVVGGVLVTLVGTNEAVLWALLPVSILVAGPGPGGDLVRRRAGGVHPDPDDLLQHHRAGRLPDRARPDRGHRASGAR